MSAILSKSRPQSRVRRHLLLAGASIVSLLASTSAHAADILRSNVTAAPITASAASQAAAQQSALAAQRAQETLTRTTQALQAMQAAQSAAHAMALAVPSSVPNGLGAGGLQVVANPVAAAQDASGLATWQGADAPTQSTDANGHVNVAIKQNDSRAILSWQSFNVGKDTTLTYNQQGNADWVALNRVTGADASPSQILGGIKADGTVLVLNQNGIIFGGSSQINVHSLIATSLDVGRAVDGVGVARTVAQRNQEFLDDGLLGYSDKNLATNDFIDKYSTFSAQAVQTGPSSVAYENLGAIKVESGAEISSGDAGYIVLAGPNVENAGYLKANQGQVILAGGDALALVRSSGASDSQTPDIRGFVPVMSNLLGVTESVLNDETGLIESPQGSVILSGMSAAVNKGGVFATTSVSRNGAIEISAPNVEIGPGSFLGITPDNSDETIPQDPQSLSDFKSSEITIGNLNGRFNSKSNPSSDQAALIHIGSDALVYAPAGNITIGSAPGSNTFQATSATSRVFVDAGAIIDASGLKNVLVPASRNQIKISPLKNNELADSPQYKDSFLNGATVYVDPRLSGVRDDGVAWIGSPLIDAASYKQQVGISAAELMTKGGNVILGVDSYSGAGPATGAPNVVVKAGATIDISGGWVTYEAGKVLTTQLITSDGRVVDIGQADPGDTFVGIYNGYMVGHSRWGVTETYAGPFGSNSYFSASYTEGRDAGSLTIKASAAAFDGTSYSQAFPGIRQTLAAQTGTASSGVYGDTRALQGAPSQLPSGGLLFIQAQAALPQQSGTYAGGADILIQAASDYQPLPQSLEYGQSILAEAGNVTVSARDPASYLSAAQLGTIDLSDALLSASSFSAISLATSGAVTVAGNAYVALAPGGSFDVLAGHKVTIDGTISVPSGHVSLATFDSRAISAGGSVFSSIPAQAGDFDVVVNGSISAAGRWINDFGLNASDMQGAAWLNGGAVTLYAAPRISTITSIASGGSPATSTDLSGSVIINHGSIVDVSGGGRVDQRGKLDLSAKGGDLSLYAETSYFQFGEAVTGGLGGGKSGFRVTGLLNQTDSGTTPYVPVNPDRVNAHVAIDPDAVRAQGFAGGGTFTLVAPEFAFGNGDGLASTELPLDFIGSSGFANYNISSYNTALVANPFNNGLGGTVAILATQTVTIGAGQNLNLSQSLLPSVLSAAQLTSLRNLSSGGDLFSVLAAAIPENTWDRKAANLTLGGLLELNVAQGGSITGEAGADLTVSKLLNQGTIRLPGGSIAQRQLMPVLYAKDGAVAIRDLSDAFSLNPDGTINENDPSQIAGLTNGQLAGSGTANTTTPHPIYFLGLLDADQGIVLSSGSVTDLSGTSIRNPYATEGTDHGLIATGRIWNGGAISSASDAAVSGQTLFQTSLLSPYQGAVAGDRSANGVKVSSLNIIQTGLEFVAGPGAILNLSGASDVYDTPVIEPGATLRNGGYAPTPVWSDAGTLSAQGGATLAGASILAHGGAPQANGGSLELLDPILVQHDPVTAQADIISADLISSAGFDTLVALGSVNSSEDVTLNLGRGFFLKDRPVILDGSSIDPGMFAPAIRSGGGALTINAPYIAFDSDFDTILTAAIGTPGNGTAVFNAKAIDFTGALLIDQSVAKASFNADGDLRFNGVVPWQQTFFPAGTTPTASLNGQIAASGDLAFTAGQVYPTTGSSFSITSAGADSTISFGRSGGATPDTPYSAGGNLLVQAANIVQGGVIRVPLGTLTLGGSSATTFAPKTESVTLADGGITSVSANGLIIPYGTTTDQIEWYFAPTSADPLTAPPQKLLTLNGTDVSIQSGAKIDITGGGDIYAYEFVPGTGGSRDVLDQLNPDTFTSNNGFQYPDGRQIYAIVPGLSNVPVAAYDPIYSNGYDLASTSGAGRRVYLSGGNGLSGGWYTLLPAKYALLPGGMRVVEQTDAENVAAGMNSVRPDGGLVVSGYFGDALSGTSQSQVRLFDVQSQSVFQTKSSDVQTLGSAYFSDLAARNGAAVPRLPADAGRLVLNPGATLSVEAAISSAAGTDGRGAQVDIGGSAIDILASLPDIVQNDGTVRVTAESLTNLNADSLLVGGMRVDNADGTTGLNVTASRIQVRNDASTPLSAAEILLVANSEIDVANGASIAATGTLSDGRTGAYQIGSNTSSGSGALLRVANGPERLVSRTAVTGAASLTVGAASLSGTAVEFDSSGADLLDSGLVIQNAKYVALGAPRIGFGADPQTYDGLALDGNLEALLTQSGAQLTLRSQSSIDFLGGDYDFGDIRFDAATLSSLDGGDVRIHGKTVGLGNAGAAGVCALCTTGNGSLSIDADAIQFTGGGIAVQSSTFTAAVPVTLAADVTIMLPAGTLIAGSAISQPAAMVIPTGTALTIGVGTGLVLPTGINGDVAEGTAVTPANLSFSIPANATYYFPNGYLARGAAQPFIAGVYRVAAMTVALPSGTAAVLGGTGEIAQTQFFGSVALSAKNGIFASGPSGLFDVGSAPLALHTPFVGDGVAVPPAGANITLPDLTLASTGTISVDGTGSAAPGALIGVPGASITIQGQSIAISGTDIRATAGNVAINATAALSLADGARIEAPGYTRTFGDNVDPTSQDAPGGHIVLKSQTGNIALGDSTLSVGSTGTLALSAPNGAVDFGAATLGGAGGGFSLDSQAAVDLAALNARVGAAGFTNSFAVRTTTGDLVLAQGDSLRAGAVNLTADGGVVDIAGTIDTSGINGGAVALYGRNGVTLEGSAHIDASAAGYAATDTRQAKGGDVTLGTDFIAAFTSSNGSITGTSGAISIAGGAVIDVSARRPGDRLVPQYSDGGLQYYSYAEGDQGGTVTLRAPVIAPAGSNTVNVSVSNAASILGAREIDLVGFRRWDLAAVADSGLYSGVTRAGNAITLDVSVGLDTAKDDGTQTVVAGINFLGDRGTPGAATLVDFIQGYDVSAAYANLGGLAAQANFHARPGTDLANDGAITLVSNWNLAAGLVNVTAAKAAGLMASESFTGASGTTVSPAYIKPGQDAAVFAGYTAMLYRTDASVYGEAPVVSLQAGGDLRINASINDGFFQFRDQTDPDYLSASIGHSSTLLKFQVGNDTTANFRGPVFTTATLAGQASSTTSLPATLYVPYSANGNSAAPATTGDPFGSATLFPLLPAGAAADSSSINLVAGADVARTGSGVLSANVNPVQINPASAGTITVAGIHTYTYGGTSVSQAYDVDFSSTTTAATTLVSADDWLAAVLAQNKTVTVGATNAAVHYGISGKTDIPIPSGADRIDSASDLIFMTLSLSTATAINGVRPSKNFSSVTLRDIAKISDPADPQYDAYLHNLYMADTLTPAAGGDFFTVAEVGTVFNPNVNPFTETTVGNLHIVASLKTASYIISKYIDPLFQGATGGQTTAIVSPLIRTGIGSINVAAAADVDLRNGAVPSYFTANGDAGSASSGAFQLGGAAIYTAGHPVDLSARTAVNPDTGEQTVIQPPTSVPASNFGSQPTYGYGNKIGGAATASGVAGILVADPVFAEGGGDVNVQAGGNVLDRRDALLASVTSDTSVRSWAGAQDQPWRVGATSSNTVARINPQLFKAGIGALAGGDVSVSAGNDIGDLLVATTGSLATDNAAGLPAPVLMTFGSGDISVSAGRDILGGQVDLASGTGRVAAGRDVASAGILITKVSDGGFQTLDNLLSIRLSDASISVDAGRDLTMQGISALGVTDLGDSSGVGNLNAHGFYAQTASVALTSNGSITIDNGNDSLLTSVSGATNGMRNAVYPASFSAAAITGDLNILTSGGTTAASAVLLAPSPSGQLDLFAGSDIAPANIAMLDAPPGAVPGAFSSFNYTGTNVLGASWVFPSVFPSTLDTDLQQQHARIALHAADSEPVRIAAGNDIGTLDAGLIVSVPKQARIDAGRDIVNMMFFGQNLAGSDITRIVAGRDITAASRYTVPQVINGPFTAPGVAKPAVQGNTFVLGGPGSLILEAGRDIGPFLNSASVSSIRNVAALYTLEEDYPGGVLSVGNEWNPWLPQTGADVSVLFGVAGGLNYDGLRETYLDPANAALMPDYLFAQVTADVGAGPVKGETTIADRSKPIYGPLLVQWMQANAPSILTKEFATTDVTADQAYAAFTALPELNQRAFLNKVYFNELKETSDPAGPSYLQYARGYRAVNALFPASDGYTQNDLTGGSNGANLSVQTGNLDLRLATIQTEWGGDIAIMGPGGRVIAGSTVRTSAQADRRVYDGGRLFGGNDDGPAHLVSPFPTTINAIPAGFEGVLSLRGGSISTFTDGDFLLNQSRLFTEGGGDIVMWSSNADLNAGQGPKTSQNFPPVLVNVSQDLYSELDRTGSTTGAGIAALKATSGASASAVYLIAPRGTVDFGDAGVRVSGDLFVAALRVANADNVQVGGKTFGVPTVTSVDTGALSAASNAAAAVAQSAMVPPTGQGANTDLPSIITVEVLGYGGSADDSADERRRRDK